jgi:hypothetical protein
MGRFLLAACVLLALAAVPARADTIAFRVETDILRMNGDGSDQRALTHGAQRYEWPSTADDGTLVAADELGRLHRIGRDGAPLGPPIPTAATEATEDAPAETPTHVRISPDGTRIAYAQLIDGDPTTLWTPVTATDLEFPGQALGQEGFNAPSWIGNDQLVLSRDVTSDAPSAVALYAVGGGDSSEEPWFDDEGSTWASGFEAVASRDGRRVAVLVDDAADNDGLPTRVALRLFTAPEGPGGPVTFRCELALEAADTYVLASPTFSPDGRRIAWAESDGIHAATLGGLDDCGALRERVLTLPGAWEPHWSAAAAPPPGVGAGGTAGGPGAGAGSTLTLSVSTRPRPRRASLRRRGLGVRVTVGAPATVRLSVRVAGKKKRYAGVLTRKLGNAGTTTVRVRLRARAVKRAKKLVLRASAPGAKPVEVSLRPR